MREVILNPNMQEDRIQRFILLLEADAVNPTGIKFDMNWWTKPVGSSFWAVPEKVDISCNTNACALGLASISGVFADEGLSYTFGAGQLVPTYNGKTDFDAGAEFFGITWMDAGVLFDPYWYPKDLRTGAAAELEVVKRLRYLLKHRTLKGYDHQTSGRAPHDTAAIAETLDAGTED